MLLVGFKLFTFKTYLPKFQSTQDLACLVHRSEFGFKSEFREFGIIIAEVSPEAGPGPHEVPVLALVLAPLGLAHGGETCNQRFLSSREVRVFVSLRTHLWRSA